MSLVGLSYIVTSLQQQQQHNKTTQRQHNNNTTQQQQQQQNYIYYKVLNNVNKYRKKVLFTWNTVQPLYYAYLWKSPARVIGGGISWLK